MTKSSETGGVIRTRDGGASPEADRVHIPKLVLLSIGVLACVLAGCGPGEYQFFGGRRTPKSGMTSKEELREALDGFEEYATTIVREVSNQLDELLPDFRTQRTTLLQRSRLSQGFHAMLEHDDPIVACLETWALCVRLTNYVEEGEGRTLYGEQQDVVIAAAREIETEMERISQLFLKDDIFDQTRRQIHSFAAQNPITGTFSNVVVYATRTQAGKPNPFTSALSIPMAPFTALKGVDRTAGAIYSVRGSMERISDIVEELPESARWQLLLLLLEMQDTEVVKTVLESMTTFSQASATFADAADGLPEELGEQVSVLVEEINTKQANLQVTLDKAEGTAAAIGDTFSTAKETIETTGHAADVIGEAAQEWESAVAATGELVRLIRDWREEAATAKTETSSATTTDYEGTVEEVATAASELTVLTGQVRELLESEALAGHIRDVNDSAGGIVDRTAIRASGLVDHITWRLILLAAAVLTMALIYRYVSTSLLVKKP
ncbi:MAG: hypothetical protein ACYTAS_24535 [Planctomycetota bacterium]